MSTKFRHLSAALSLCALALLPAAHAASKTAVAPMGMEDARYLLTRVGFSPSPSEIKQYAGLSREAAVDKLLAETHTKPQTAWPVEVGTYPDVAARRKMTEPERREAARLERQKRPELRAWWLGEMIATDSPLTERMTLFWHNHFVSSQAKVRAQSLMLDQNLTLRENAVGNFGQLLAATSKGPAMVIYLDAGKSKKTEPNENFAREVMELFSLGEGNYSERDIKEAARAFTGWSVNGRTGQFVDDAKQHDAGEKTIFGQRGNFNGDDVLRLILQRPETASFISKKLWLEFVSTNPTPAEIQNLANVFRQSKYEIKPVLRAMFLNPTFWAADTRGALVKSPAELVVGTMRGLNADVPNALPLVRNMTAMGQDLFAPPNVRGWPGGAWWINSATLLERKQFLDRVARADDSRSAPKLAMAAGMSSGMGGETMAEADKKAEQREKREMAAMRKVDLNLQAWSDEVGRLGYAPEKVLLPVPPVDGASMAKGSERVRVLLLDPAYQLK